MTNLEKLVNHWNAQLVGERRQIFIRCCDDFAEMIKTGEIDHVDGVDQLLVLARLHLLSWVYGEQFVESTIGNALEIVRWPEIFCEFQSDQVAREVFWPSEARPSGYSVAREAVGPDTIPKNTESRRA